MKKRLQAMLTDPKHKHFFLVNDVLAIVTVVSILSLILETVPSLAPYQTWFVIVEWVTVAIFLTEYLLRIYVAKQKRSYVCSFFGLVDLIAILPTIFGIGNLTFLKSARALRLIRLLRMIRLAKLIKLGKVRDHDEHMSVYALNILIYIGLLTIALLTFSTALYLFEGESDMFLSIPAAMSWTIRVFVGSIIVDEPVTAIGQALYVMTRFTGLILLGVLIGVVGNMYRQLMIDHTSSK